MSGRIPKSRATYHARKIPSTESTTVTRSATEREPRWKVRLNVPRQSSGWPFAAKTPCPRGASSWSLVIPSKLNCTRPIIVTSAPVSGVARNSPRMRLWGEVHVAIVTFTRGRYRVLLLWTDWTWCLKLDDCLASYVHEPRTPLQSGAACHTIGMLSHMQGSRCEPCGTVRRNTCTGCSCCPSVRDPTAAGGCLAADGAIVKLRSPMPVRMQGRHLYFRQTPPSGTGPRRLRAVGRESVQVAFCGHPQNAHQT